MSENIKVSSKIELLPHNQELYDKIVEQIEKGEKSIFYSQATGLGKSFIFMKLVEDYFQGKRIMYVVPKIAIWGNLTRYKEFQTLNATIDMFTYQSFNNYDNSLVDRYDVVFIDECHHMLSDIQGTNIMTYCLDMNKVGKFTFGFTATPYYQDKYVDEECFDVSCYGYDVYEAIDKGILPKIKLALANINLDEVPWDLKVQYSITGTKNLLNKIIDEHKDINRWLAYFPNAKVLEERAHELSLLFPDYKVLKTYYGYELDDLAIDEFNEYNGKVIILSVNRLLEGVHLKNVQGVLLYRNVVEFSTYMQMYGRLCDINTKTTPLFLDVSNALLSFKGISEMKSSRYTGEIKQYSYKDLFDITSNDYWTIELSEYLLNLNTTPKEYRGVRYTNPLSLAIALGVSHHSVYAYIDKTGKTLRDYIDMRLKDITYDEYIKNGYVYKYKLFGYTFTDKWDLARQLGVQKRSFAHWDMSIPPEEYLSKINKRNPIKIKYPKEVYRGIDVSKRKYILEFFGLTESQWNQRMKYCDHDVKVFVDRCLDDEQFLKYGMLHDSDARVQTAQQYPTIKDYYRGIPLCNMKQLSKFFNLTEAACRSWTIKHNGDLYSYAEFKVNKMLEEGMTEEQIDDFICSRNKELGYT